MRALYYPLILMFSLLIASCGHNVQKKGKWEIEFNKNQKNVTIRKDGKAVFNHLYPAYKLGDKLIKPGDYATQIVNSKEVNDAFGEALVFEIVYSDNELPTLTQHFYLYNNKDYILTDFTLESDKDIASNYMAPVCADTLPAYFENAENRALFISYDNDKWIRFQSHPLTFDKLVSYEVTTVFNNNSRNGLVIGSVEHDNWKTGVEMTGSSNGNNISKLICYGGIANETTRDSKPHGELIGKTIKSPKILIGFFDDWRTGMETYANANATVTPPRAWDKAVPFGWNSWGVLQFNLTYPKAMEVSDFFREHLQNNGFANADNLVYVGLDSGWNSFTEEELKSFVEKCKENGQVAGVYWTPFTDWGKNPESHLHNAPDYQFKDIYLYANGKPQELDGAYAIDPTHPAIEQRMQKTADLFHRCGFEYVKMDFMTHGALEADSWYNPEISTGVQAYNYGLALMDKYFGDMYINLSISPIFPAQYAQSRRIACDAWNKIKDTEYTMNALSYGWWIDRVYQFNDADHIVLRQATEGENRARVTSAVITGVYIAGGDFSKEGTDEGKEKAKTFLTNKAINAVAQGNSFKPVEGNGEKSENQFTYSDDNGNVYYVIFNYTDNEINTEIPLERLGVTQPISATELWSGDAVDINSTLSIPAKDVKFIKIEV